MVLPGTLGRDAVEADIVGTVAQTARFTMAKGDSLWASRGSIVSYTGRVRWELRVPGGAGAAVKRAFAGEGIALARVHALEDGQRLTLGANGPGHIASWDLVADGPVLTTRGAFLAAWGSDIDISVSVARRAGAALFGGAGLVLQRITGSGTVLVQGRGDFDRAVLGADEELFVSTGNLAAFGSGLDYDVQAVGSVRKTFFGGEGLFMTRLRGPGTALLQSLKLEHRRSRGG
jgi:uncharacterized protein (AIM24 family)